MKRIPLGLSILIEKVTSRYATDAGFDDVYLDIIDSFKYFEEK